MICGGPIRFLAARAIGIVAVLVMVLVVLVSSAGQPETHDADHTVVTAAQQLQVQGFASCHAQVSCVPFIAPTGTQIATPNAVRKAKYASFGKAAANLFGPAFETPRPRA